MTYYLHGQFEVQIETNEDGCLALTQVTNDNDVNVIVIDSQYIETFMMMLNLEINEKHHEVV